MTPLDFQLFRIEANQLEDRTINRMWLVRHLEIIRQLTTDDLKIIKVTILINQMDYW